MERQTYTTDPGYKLVEKVKINKYCNYNERMGGTIEYINKFYVYNK